MVWSQATAITWTNVDLSLLCDVTKAQWVKFVSDERLGFTEPKLQALINSLAPGRFDWNLK